MKRITGESDEYSKAREELLEAEIALRVQRGAVAEMRRSLPPAPIVPDYVFHDAADGRQVKLSELFEKPDRPLLVDQLMYGGAQQKPCPMCSMWGDGYDAVTPHLLQRTNFVLVAQAEPERLAQLGRDRGWKHMRLLSSQASSFKTDLGFQDADGGQRPGLSVFTRDADGTLRHFYSQEAEVRPGVYNGIDLMSPVWNLFDLLPDGRGDWFPSVSYP